MTRFLCLALLVSFAAGCNSPLLTRCAKTPNVERFRTEEQLDMAAEAQAAQNTKSSSGQIVNVLTLSGGGAWGAFGAGYLCGWRENPKNFRPEYFDVVTGISTGGLQATAAFIGEDALLKQGYTTVDRDDIMRQRFPPLVSALWSRSLYDSTPLGEQIETLFTNPIIDRVAIASDGGRRKLYVATCELESGHLMFWDLTAIAEAKEYDLYRCVVLATASIPAVFPAVNIGGKLHVDGGTRASLFLTKSLSPLLNEQHDNLSVYVIVNGQVSIAASKPINRTLKVAARALGMLLAAQSGNNIRQLGQFAKDHRALFWLRSVPSDYVPSNARDFDRAEMNRLFELGRKLASEDGWSYVEDNRPSFKAPPMYFDANVEQQMKQK